MPPLSPFARSCLALAISQAIAAPTTAATIMVNNIGDISADDGMCTLREAITSSNTDTASGGTMGECAAGSGNDIIEFDAATFPSSSSQTISLSASHLPITPNVTVTVNGPGKDQLFIQGSTSRVFHIDSATALINNLTVTGAQTNENGGGFFITNSSNVTIDNCTVSDNTATRGGGILAELSSSVNLTNSTVSGNSSSFNGGGVYAITFASIGLANSTVSGNSAVQNGGGIEVGEDSSISLADSTLSGNSANFGGGIDAGLSSSTILIDSALSENTAIAGGAIWAGFGSSVSLTNSMVKDNTLLVFLTPDGARGGGGIFALSSVVSLTDSTVSGNSAAYFGGGIYAGFSSTVSLANSTVSDNSAAQKGGGIHTRNLSNVSLTDSFLSGNSARYGGGIEASAGIYKDGGIVSLVNTTLSGNSARNGGGISAVYSSVSLTNSTVSANSAMFFSGGIYAGASSLTINNSTVSGNSADTGGGINAGPSSSVNLSNSTVSGNLALSGGGGLFLFQSSASIGLTNSIVSGNTAPRGGEIDNNSAATITADNGNLFGEVGHTKYEAFYTNFYAGATDIIATSDGDGLSLHRPTAFSSILEPLADNGGPTETHALPAGSPALDAGKNPGCPVTDQRGEKRNDGKCDIGAYEIPDDSSFFVIPLQHNGAVIFSL